MMSLVSMALLSLPVSARPASSAVTARLRRAATAAAQRGPDPPSAARAPPGGAQPPRPARAPKPPPAAPATGSVPLVAPTAAPVSNRAAFRAVPLDARILERLSATHACTDTASAGRIATRKRAQGDQRPLTRRYPLYGEVPPEVARVVGTYSGPGPGRTRFLAAATAAGSLPTPALPEVALAGRSNVGKSSLVNALTLSAVARQSDKPGLTQSLNFYGCGGAAPSAPPHTPGLLLVDLPGYGFAFAQEARVEKWNALMDSYLGGRGRTLRRVLLVLDARHGLKSSDRDMLLFLSRSGCKFQVVLNKADMVTPPELARRISLIAAEVAQLKGAHGTVHALSTATGAGVAVLASELFKLAEERKGGEPAAAEVGTGMEDALARLLPRAAAKAALNEEVVKRAHWGRGLPDREGMQSEEAVGEETEAPPRRRPSRTRRE